MITGKYTYEELEKIVDDQWENMSKEEKHSRIVNNDPTVEEHALSAMDERDIVIFNNYNSYEIKKST